MASDCPHKIVLWQYKRSRCQYDDSTSYFKWVGQYQYRDMMSHMTTSRVWHMTANEKRRQFWVGSRKRIFCDLHAQRVKHCKNRCNPLWLLTSLLHVEKPNGGHRIDWFVHNLIATCDFTLFTKNGGDSWMVGKLQFSVGYPLTGQNG